MFINKIKNFHKSQNVPHSHFMDEEGQKVNIFFEIVWFKTKILYLLGTNKGQI